VLVQVEAAIQVLRAELQLELTQLMQAADAVWWVRSSTAPSGSAQPPPASLLPPLEELLEPPPSSSLEASSPPKLLPPLLFEEQAIAAPNEPTITAVHATDLSITPPRSAAQYAGAR
jgi:hypothetical protein